ncbi:hypothetical protein JD844_033631, partial [Phrynosoma platyrhinos]
MFTCPTLQLQSWKEGQLLVSATFARPNISDVIVAVGLGSWCFHMTLKYEMQLLDELPMIYSCCMFVYCLYECFKYKKTINYPLLFLLLAYSIGVTIVSSVMYGTLVAVLVLRSVYIVLWVYPWLRGLGYTSLTVFLLGFFLWNVDNIFCDKLRYVNDLIYVLSSPATVTVESQTFRSN